jgi:hypothetical protein
MLIRLLRESPASGHVNGNLEGFKDGENIDTNPPRIGKYFGDCIKLAHWCIMKKCNTIFLPDQVLNFALEFLISQSKF